MNRFTIRLLIGILVTSILAVGLGGLWWWKTAELKKNLVHDLETALGAKVELTSLDFDLWHRQIRAAGISLVNQRANAPWEKGEIGQAVVHFRLQKLFASTLPLNVEVSSWNVVLSPFASKSSGTSMASESEPAPPVPPESKIKVMRLSAQQGEVEIDLSDEKKVLLHSVAFEASDSISENWTTHLKAESIAAGSLEAGPSSVQLDGDRDKVSFSHLRMPCGSGMITGDGNISLNDPHKAHASLKATNVPVTMLVGLQWQMKLSGMTTGDVTYDGDDQSGDASGHIELSAGKFNVLPWLGKVTELVNLPDITNVEVDRATTDFEWKKGTLHFTNLDIRKNEVMRLSGAIDVDPQGQVDGRLKLGLPSTATAKWPQLQEKIFSVQLENYNWTDVHLTGTPDHLQEDLTPRLVAAGAAEGGGMINQASQKALDLLKGFLGN
jgi:hypothetical protein